MPPRQFPSCREPLLLDGAMGSELLAQGFSVDPVEVLTTHAEAVASLHRAYHMAGARMHTTATFQLNPMTLEASDNASRLPRLAERALLLARQSVGPGDWVLAGVGPFYDPSTSEEFLDFDLLRETVAFLGRADGLLLETHSRLDVLRAVAYLNHRVPEVAELPILLSIAYRKEGPGVYRTASGHSPEAIARHAVRHGVTVLGVGCGRDIGLVDLEEILRRYRQETDLPLMVRGNAGTPRRVGDRWVYPTTPEEFAAFVPRWIAAGATLLGGCCGTTPQHIAAMAAALVRS